MRSCSSLLSMLMLLLFFTSAPARAELENDDCLGCHADADLAAETERGKKLQLHVDPQALFGSAHEDLDCTDCHVGADSFEEAPHAKGPLEVACESCHEEIFEKYIKQDIHGFGHKNGNPRAPYCQGCHGGHRILPKSSIESKMSRMNQVTTCGRCHGSEELNTEEGIFKRNLISRYESSVHWAAIQQGKTGATCTDCHGHHTILSSDKPDSTVSETGLVNVCITCHPNEARSFRDGAHGRALFHGNHDVPTCTTCHGDHDMASLRSRQGDAKQWAATQVCIWCHGNPRMMARYGLDTTPVDSYMRDFHGLTQRGTFGASATCADCHDPHHSLPTDHPQSRMNVTNRGAACGKCHGKVTENFAQSFTHRKALAKPGTRVEEIVRILYILLIIASVIGMLGHNLVIWLHAVRKKLAGQHGTKRVRRMSSYEVSSHLLLAISFTILVLSGFALKFPDAFWVRWLFEVGMVESVRAYIHRTAAVVMSLDMLVFALYTLGHARGKRVLKSMLPRRRDVTDFLATMRFYRGKQAERPRYAIFNYAEKFEFWALVWGTAIMAVTGFVLWFPQTIPGSWPPWIIPVARTIHYLEALLATLAIIIWHGFHTIYHPDEYPMNTTWLTGFMTRAEATHRFEDAAVAQMTGNGKAGDETQEQCAPTAPGPAADASPDESEGPGKDAESDPDRA